jgi:hypothetical protein
MPELDFMVVADYVRAEGAVLHMIAAGFDTMFVPAVPAARAVGIGLRLLVDVAEAASQHRVALIYLGTDGQRLAEIAGTLGPLGPDQPLPPEGRPFIVPMAFNLTLPVPAYGDYSLELFVDDQEEAVKSIVLTAVAMPVPPSPVGHA